MKPQFLILGSAAVMTALLLFLNSTPPAAKPHDHAIAAAVPNCRTAVDDLALVQQQIVGLETALTNCHKDLVEAVPKQLGLRPMCKTDVDTRRAWEYARKRTARAAPECPGGKQLRWPLPYSAMDLEDADLKWKPNAVPRVCIGMPVTSRHIGVRESYEQRANYHPKEFLLYRQFIVEMLKHTNANEDRLTFDLYLAVDEGDPFFDNTPRFNTLRQVIDEATKARGVKLTVHDPLVLPLLYGNNVYFWNTALAQGFLDGCDYLYQASDDNLLGSGDFFYRGVTWLNTCRDFEGGKYRNLGIMCPADPAALKERFCYQGMISRDVFLAIGNFFDESYTTWGADDYVQQLWETMGVYGWDPAIMQSRNSDDEGKRYEPCRSPMVDTVNNTVAVFMKWFKERGGKNRAFLQC